MIPGALELGIPSVACRLTIQGLGLRRVQLRIDTGSARTVLTVPDIRPAFEGGLPLDDVVDVVDVPGVQVGLPRAASLVFVNDDLPHQELVEIFVVEGPPGASRLGRDVLSRWLMVYDEHEDLLFFAPHES